MRFFKYAILFTILTQKGFCSSASLTEWLTNVNAPILLSKSTIKEGQELGGGIAAPSMKMAYVSIEDFDKLLLQYCPLSRALRTTKLDYQKIRYADELIHFFAGKQPIVCYGTGEAKLFESGKGDSNQPLYISLGIFDCVGLVIESPRLKGFMHVSFQNYKKETPQSGRLLRLLEKFSKEDIKASTVSLISGSYSALTESVISDLQQKGFKNLRIQVADCFASREELVRVFPLSTLEPGTTLDHVRALNYIQQAPMTKASVFCMPAMSIYDCNKKVFLQISTPMLIKNMNIQKLIQWCLHAREHEILRKEIPFVKAFFTLAERKSNLDDLEILKSAGQVFLEGISESIKTLNCLCTSIGVDLQYHLSLLLR